MNMMKPLTEKSVDTVLVVVLFGNVPNVFQWYLPLKQNYDYANYHIVGFFRWT